jgi:hypothetical protein
VETYVQARITRLCAVSCSNRVLAAVSEELTLLEVLRQVVVDDESALDDSMCASMGTAVAMTVDVPLGFLNQVDLFGDGIDIVLLVLWDLLYTFSIPTNIVSTGEVFLLDIVGVLVWSFVDGQLRSTIDDYSGRHDDFVCCNLTAD